MESWAFFCLSRAPSTPSSRNFSWQAGKALWGSITAYVTVKPFTETNTNGILFGMVAYPIQRESRKRFLSPLLTAEECNTPPAALLYTQVPSLDGYLHLHLHFRLSKPERATNRAVVDEAWIPQTAIVQVSSRKEAVSDIPVILEWACQRELTGIKTQTTDREMVLSDSEDEELLFESIVNRIVRYGIEMLKPKP